MTPFMRIHPFRLILTAMIIALLVGAVPWLSAQEGLGRGRVSGTVVDENGKPIEGAVISVASAQSSAKFEEKSDRKGNFAVAGMGTGVWRLTATKNGFNSNYVDVNVRQLAINPPVTITLKALSGVAAIRSDEEALKQFDEGNRFMEEGKYDEALKIFEDALAKHPDVYAIHLNIGSTYLKKGDLDKAEAEYKVALDGIMKAQGDLNRDKITSVRALSGLAEVALKKGDLKTAQGYFTQALDISPEDEIAAYNVGEVFFSNQQIDDAIRYFELAIKIKSDWPKPYSKLGYVYLNKGDMNSALDYFRKFIQMAPNDPEAEQVKKVIELLQKK